MHIHIDQCRIQIESKHIGRKAITMQHVLIRGAHCMREQLVAYKTTIHIKILRVCS